MAHPSAATLSVESSPHEAMERWDRRVAAGDPTVLKELQGNQLPIDERVYALDACFKHQAWGWVDQVWPPPEELNQRAFVHEWVLDAMSSAGPQRAMALYHRADVAKTLSSLLTSAVVRADPALWEAVTGLADWSDEQGLEAAIEFTRWGSQHPRYRKLAREWFLRLAKAIPEPHNQAHLVRTAFRAKGMEQCAWPLFQRLPYENQRQAALEIYPRAESTGQNTWVRRCWKVLEAPGAHQPGQATRVLSLDFLREWFRDTTEESQHRLLPCLDDDELYTAWQAARLEQKEELALAAWERLRDRPVPVRPPLRFMALSNAMEDGSVAWCSRWWCPALEASLAGEQHFQLAILSYTSDDPAMKAWTQPKLNWSKLEHCVRRRDDVCEDFESAALDEALLKAPADVCAHWIQHLHGTVVELPLTQQRVMAGDRERIASTTAPTRSRARHRHRS